MLTSAADPNLNTRSRHSALLRMLKRGNIDILTALVQAGMSLESNIKDDWDPMEYAVQNCSLAVVKYLVKLCVSLIKSDIYYVRDAIKREDPALVLFLIKNQALVNTHTRNNQTLLHDIASSTIPNERKLIEAILASNTLAKDVTLVKDFQYRSW